MSQIYWALCNIRKNKMQFKLGKIIILNCLVELLINKC